METQVRTPQMIFMQPQRLIVPLFQRPYVWNQENQWEPLWNDVTRVAERLILRPQDRHYPHFLGAVVLQQVQTPTGAMQERIIIDGQQRLTTLQILLDALHAEFHALGATQQAMRLDALVANQKPFWERPEDRFKVWPTNRDRAAFNAVMTAEPPVAYDTIPERGARMVQAHRFFTEEAHKWLLAGDDTSSVRVNGLERAVRDLLQMVVIDLTAEENAQEIFETLNARGAQLTAADLIKNFIFQRLIEGGVDVEAAYERFWKEFETGFWETEINVGRVRYPRSSIFLNHWLIARTGEEVVTREVFSRFKTYADFDAALPMGSMLEQVHRAASVYRHFVTTAALLSAATDRISIFGYRTGVLESEVIKPVILHLLDPEAPKVPEVQLFKALDVIESWMVRRMLVRATTKPYAQVVADLITRLRSGDRGQCGDLIEHYFAQQKTVTRYWPDDTELRDELRTLLAYRRLGRSRLRMVLEAIEDFLRGWKDGQSALGGERVARGKYAIEHIMPRKWATHWSLPDGRQEDPERDRLIHTLGNLTLLTGKLNSKVSHGPWAGPGGKREALEAHDVFLLNRTLHKAAGDTWTDDGIRARTEELIEIILKIWPVPEGHEAGFSSEKARPHRRIELADLINAGWLEAGMTLYPRRKKFAERTATLLPDGRVDVDGKAFSAPSPAAVAITGKGTNGWWFFLVDQAARRSLKDVLQEYIETLAVDADDDDTDDDTEDD